MYPVRPILTTRIDAHGRFLGTIPLSVINFVGFANAFESILILVESVLIGHDNAKEKRKRNDKFSTFFYD